MIINYRMLNAGLEMNKKMPSRGLWLWFPLWLHNGGSSLRLGDGPGMALWLVPQMAIENSVSNDFSSTFVDSINFFDCRLPGVKMM